MAPKKPWTQHVWPVNSYLHALSRHDWEGIRRVCQPDYIHHAPGVPEAGLEKYVATLQLVVEAVPDMTLEIQQIVATEEYATLRYTVHGTHLYDFHGIPPSGAPIVMPAIGLVRVKDGRLARAGMSSIVACSSCNLPSVRHSLQRKRDKSTCSPTFIRLLQILSSLRDVIPRFCGRHVMCHPSWCIAPARPCMSSIPVWDLSRGAVLKAQIAILGQGAEEIVLVNSHGHFDHLGNNDLLQQSAIRRRTSSHLKGVRLLIRIFAQSYMRCMAGQGLLQLH